MSISDTALGHNTDDLSALRRVLHIRNVTQCALLPDFGTFLVLADKDLWAYDIESMVPSSRETQSLARPRERLNGKKDVYWFRVGHYNDRTLLVYMTKRLVSLGRISAVAF